MPRDAQGREPGEPGYISPLHASGKCLKGHKHRSSEAAILCDMKAQYRRDKQRERQQNANEGYY